MGDIYYLVPKILEVDLLCGKNYVSLHLNKINGKGFCKFGYQKQKEKYNNLGATCLNLQI